MCSLLDLQRQMREHLGDDESRVALAHIAGDGAAERLAVYRNTITGALARALRLNFPTVERLVGHEFFDGAAGLFARQEVPCGADLNRYGQRFPSFLQSLASCASLPYLPDSARLDWAVSRALHAPDAQPVVAEDLAALGDEQAERLRLALHPSVSQLSSAFAIDRLWRAVLERDDAALVDLDLASGPVHLLVHRAENGAQVVRLTPLECRFTAALGSGTAFGELIELFGAQQASALLAQTLLAGRAIAAVSSTAGATS